MSKPDVLQIGAYSPWDEEALAEHFAMHRLFEVPDADKAAYIAERADRLHAVATRGELIVDRAFMETLPNLQIVAVYGVGYDGVDVEVAKSLNVRVTNTPDVLTAEVADFGVAMLLAAARGIVGGDQWVRSGNWASQGAFELQRPVHSKKLGIIGLGRIGKAIAKRCAAFDMEIAYTNRSQAVDVDWRFEPDPVKLAQWADYVVVMLPGGPATRHVVSAQVIDAIGPEGMLVNVSRGSTVDEEALIDALKTGRLGYAALDVFENEPNIDTRFFDLPNVLLQPHQGSATLETRKAMGRLMIDNLRAHFAGEDLLTPVV